METSIQPSLIEQPSISKSTNQEIRNVQYQNPSNHLPSAHDLTSALLNRLFPEQNQEEKLVRQTRVLLGGLIENYSKDQLEEIIIQIQYLSETWLDTYERKVFDGKTLNELLNMG